MTPAAARHVVVGGGISGLLAALLAAESAPRTEVWLIERESDVGGLLRSFDYGQHGRFDYGMHNMYETGVRELDDLLFGLLPAGQWHLLEGHKRDIAGLFYDGRLQRNSLYMDLRHLPRERFERCVAGFFANLCLDDGNSSENARRYAEIRFGKAIADTAVAPAVTKIYKRDAGDMDVMGAMLTSIDRVILFDEQLMPDLMKADILRERIAYPEQRRLPVERASGRKGYYPRDYGMYRVIDAFRRRLAAAGARILTSAQLRRVERSGARITALDVVHDGTETRIAGVDFVHWTAGLPALAPLLGLSLQGLAFDRPLRTVAVNFLLDRDTLMEDLYYFYCYDAGLDTFRVTNFIGYCDNARRAGGTPLCVELLLDAAAPAEPQDYVGQARLELERFGILTAGTKVLFAKAEQLAYGFPMPTVRNVSALHTIREGIDALGIANLVTLGILAEPRLFFQKDVVTHTYRKMRACLDNPR